MPHVLLGSKRDAQEDEPISSILPPSHHPPALEPTHSAQPLAELSAPINNSEDDHLLVTSGTAIAHWDLRHLAGVDSFTLRHALLVPTRVPQLWRETGHRNNCRQARYRLQP
jgi:hypothetical protein